MPRVFVGYAVDGTYLYKEAVPNHRIDKALESLDNHTPHGDMDCPWCERDDEEYKPKELQDEY